MISHIFTVDVEYWYHGFSDSEVASADPRVVLPHYMNLSKTRDKLARLLDRFSFSSISQSFSGRNNQYDMGGGS